MIDLFDVLAKTSEVALAIGAMQKDNLGKSDLAINAKSSSIDLVTEIDKKAEQAIIAFIKKGYPGHGILAEESGETLGESDYLWIIDPLDGTTNYAQGLPIFAVSIALQYRGETVLGIVYTAVTDQLFTAIKGHGAYLNGQRLQVSAKQKLIESLLATGFPYDIGTHPANNIAYFSRLALKTRGIRRMGAAAYDIACVAAGKFDGYWEMKLSPWDCAAAMLMVEEAGGKIIHFRNDQGISIIVGNATISEQILKEIRIVDQEGGGRG